MDRVKYVSEVGSLWESNNKTLGLSKMISLASTNYILSVWEKKLEGKLNIKWIQL